MAKVIRLDNMSATKDGSLIKSAQYIKNNKATKIENGELVEVGDLLPGEREIHEVSEFTEGNGKNVGIVCTPEIDKTKDRTPVTDFINQAGDTIRVMLLHKGDIFSIGNTSTPGADIDIDGTMVAKFQGTEVVMSITYNVYEVKSK